MTSSDTPALKAPLPGCATTARGDTGLRTLDIEEPTNRYFVHKISLSLVPVFTRLGVTPNMVSGLGALCGLFAAWSYFHYDNPWACALGFVLMIGWHVCDGADGQLARQTGQTSELGFVIDGVCDYLTFVCVYVALGLALAEEYGQWIWFLIWAAGVCHAVQAAAFEMQREHYIAWTTFRHGVGERGTGSAMPWLARTYRAIQVPFRPVPKAFEHRLQWDAATGADVYRLTFRRTVLAWSMLSANNRTIAVFLFCLIGNPLGYFLYESVVLTTVLIGLLGANARARSRLLHVLD